jgi:GH18 family chitinase
MGLSSMLLFGCGGSGSSGPTSPPKGVGGLAGSGAPIVEGQITVYNANGAVISTTPSSKLGEWKLDLSSIDKTQHPYPWLVKGEATGVPTVWSIVFENDIGATNQAVNINPFTTAALVMAGVKVGDDTLDAADIAALKTQTQSTIVSTGARLSTILSSALAKMPTPLSGNIFEQLRTTPFWGNSTGLDAVLDAMPVRFTADGKITLQVSALNAAVTIDTAAAQTLEQQVTDAKITMDAAVTTAGALLQTPPTLLAFDVQSSWGSAADSWAGFTGAATVLATKDYGKSPVIKLTSKGFPGAGWWGASAIYDKGTGEITLTLPEWTNMSRGGTYSLGFNGTASKETLENAVKTASGCRINGDPCVITFGPAKSSDQGTLSTAAYFSAYGSFFENATKTKEDVDTNNKETGNKTKEATNKKTETSGDKSNNNNGNQPNTETGGNNTDNPATSYLVTVSSGGGWSSGFNGTIKVKNTSTASIANWSVSLPVTAGAFSGAPAAWNGNFAYTNGSLTVTPSSWANKSLAPGETWSSGFNGGSAKAWLDLPTTSGTNVTFQPDASLISLRTTQTSTTPTPTPVPPAPIPSPSPAPTPSTDGPQNWEKASSTGVTNTTANPCNAVVWGKVESVGAACLALMESKEFGGPSHTGANGQIPLTGGKPNFEAFGYLVEWGVYGRKFGVENVSAAQYSKLLFSFLRLKPDGTLMITDDWASLQKDDTGTLLGLSSDPFASTWDNQDRGIMKRLIMLKARFPHLKTAFSIGGWTLSGQFASVTADSVKRMKLIDSSIAFANKFGFDGIDIDWEYPVVGGNLDSAMPGVNYAEANPGFDTDATNYTTFLRELRAAINANGAASNRSRTKSGKIEVSIAVGLGPKTIDAINFSDFIDHIDTVNLMAYDFNGGWSSVVSHNAPLYDNNGQAGAKSLTGGFDQSEWNNHDAVLNILWNLKNQGGKALRSDGELGKARVHKGDNGSTSQQTREALLNDPTLTNYRKKLVLGIPFYGRIWASSDSLGTGDLTKAWFSGTSASMGSLENGVADTKDVLYARDNQTEKIKQNGRASNWPLVRINESDIHWDPVACASLMKTSGHIVSFDDEDGIYHKAKYAKDKGLGGVMVWEVDGDTADGKLAKGFIAGMTGGVAPKGKTCAHKP